MRENIDSPCRHAKVGLDVRLVYSDRLHERGATSSANISVE